MTPVLGVDTADYDKKLFRISEHFSESRSTITLLTVSYNVPVKFHLPFVVVSRCFLSSLADLVV